MDSLVWTHRDAVCMLRSTPWVVSYIVFLFQFARPVLQPFPILPVYYQFLVIGTDTETEMEIHKHWTASTSKKLISMWRG